MQTSLRSLAGLGYVTPSGDEVIDIDNSLVFNYALPAGATINSLSQPVSADGDFILCGVQMTSFIKQTPVEIELQGNAGVRFSDDSGYKLMNDYVNVAFMTPQAGNSYPYVIRPAHLFKAGTRINIDLQELSNITDEVNGPLTNLIQIVFRGRYRYRVSTLIAQQQLLRNANQIKQRGY